MADGSIIIDTKINIKNAKSDMASLTKQIEDTQQQMDMLVDDFMRMQKGIALTDQSMEGLVEQFKANSKEYSDLVEKQKQLTDEVNKYASALTSTDTHTEKVSANIDEQNKAWTGVAHSIGKIKIDTKNLEKTFKGIGNSITRGAKSLVRFGLALVGIRGISSLIRSSISEWASSGNAEAKQLQANLSQLKQSIASGLLPVINAVLTLFYKILGVVNAIVKAFTGVDFLAKSTAKSTGATAKNAKGALASFDEINTLNKSEGGGAGDIAGNLQDIIPDFSNIEELIKNQDWYGLGQYVAGQINDGMASIDWDAIQLKAGIGGEGLAEGLNGLTENLDWEGVGNTIAQGFNTALNFAYNFLKTFNWKAFGTGIADLINGAVKNTDWKLLAKTISEGIKGAVSGITTFFREINWTQIGKSIFDFLAGIDWGGLLLSFFDVLKFLIIDTPKMISDMITGFLEEGFKAAVDYFKPFVEEHGGNVALGLLAGIAKPFETIGAWLNEHVFTPFMDKLKELFGIAGEYASTMYDIAKYIVGGIKQGLIDKWEDIKTWFDENVAPKLKLSYWTEKLNNMKDGIKKAFTDTFNGVIDIVERAVNFIVDKLNTLHWDLPDWVEDTFGISGFGFDLKRISIPRLAKGGIAYQPTQAIIGDAGREAVLPLDRNTEWMEDLAEMISQNQSFNINFEGNLSQLARVLNPAIKKEQRRTGARLIGGAV